MPQDPDFKQKAEKFLATLWGERAAGGELPDIDWTADIRQSDIAYLAKRMPYLVLRNPQATLFKREEAKHIVSSTGWVIKDYGDSLQVSPGESLFADKNSLSDVGEAEGEGEVDFKPGTGSIIQQAFTAAYEMVEIALENWGEVGFYEGSELMAWAAWMACMDKQQDLFNYEPDEAAVKRRRLIIGETEAEDYYFGPGL